MRRNWFIVALVVFLPLAFFAQTLAFDFVWDDEVNVARNPYLNPVSGTNVLRFWQEPYERLYVPLTYTVWAVGALFARGGDKLNPSVFHLSNLLFHVLSALAVFAILRKLIRSDWAAAAGALLFALHPIQVEPVAWITGMKDVLAGFLALIAIWQYLLYAGSDRAETKITRPPPSRNRRQDKPQSPPPVLSPRFHYAFATIAFVLSMLAKPSAVVTPLIALVLDYWILRRSFKEIVRGISVWLIAAAVCVISARWIQPTANLDFITPLWARPLIAGDALAFYLYKLFIPLWLGPDYGRLPESVLEGKWSYFTWVVPVAAAILLYFFCRRDLWFAAAAAIFAIGILPVAGLLPFSFQNTSTVADRYLYLSMLGPALATAWLISRADGRLVAVGSACVILVLCLGSAVQARHWRDDEILFSYALRLNPNSWTAYYGLGRALAGKNKTDQAIAAFREAARLKPEFTNAHFSLGSLLAAKGEYDAAIDAYRRSLAIAPTFVDARLGLIRVLISRGDFTGAEEEFNQALKIDPRRADLYFNLANLQARAGNLGEAARNLERALRLRPDLVIAHNQLGRVLAAQGDLPRAIDHFRQAVRIDPTFAEAHESLAMALLQEGARAEAERHFREAQRLRALRHQSSRSDGGLR